MTRSGSQLTAHSINPSSYAAVPYFTSTKVSIRRDSSDRLMDSRYLTPNQTRSGWDSSVGRASDRKVGQVWYRLGFHSQVRKGIFLLASVFTAGTLTVFVQPYPPPPTPRPSHPAVCVFICACIDDICVYSYSNTSTTYVCIHIFLFTCLDDICVYSYSDTSTRYVCIHIRIHRRHLRVFIFVYIDISVYSYSYISTFVCIHIRIHRRHLCVSIFVCIDNISVYSYSHASTTSVCTHIRVYRRHLCAFIFVYIDICMFSYSYASTTSARTLTIPNSCSHAIV